MLLTCGIGEDHIKRSWELARLKNSRTDFLQETSTAIRLKCKHINFIRFVNNFIVKLRLRSWWRIETPMTSRRIWKRIKSMLIWPMIVLWFPFSTRWSHSTSMSSRTSVSKKKTKRSLHSDLTSIFQLLWLLQSPSLYYKYLDYLSNFSLGNEWTEYYVYSWTHLQNKKY